MNIQTILTHPVEFINFFLTADIGFIVCKHLEPEREKQQKSDTAYKRKNKCDNG